MARPRKFKTIEELDERIEYYFALAEAEKKPTTLSGRAYFLGISRKTLQNYKGEYPNHVEFFPTVEAAKSRCEIFWEESLHGPYSAGAKFNLTNNHDEWKDEKVHGLTDSTRKSIHDIALAKLEKEATEELEKFEAENGTDSD